jgi:hypothetical protein
VQQLLSFYVELILLVQHGLLLILLWASPVAEEDLHLQKQMVISLYQLLPTAAFASAGGLVASVAVSHLGSVLDLGLDLPVLLHLLGCLLKVWPQVDQEQSRSYRWDTGHFVRSIAASRTNGRYGHI